MSKDLYKKIDLLLRFLRALKQGFKSFLYDFIRFSRYSIQNTFPEDEIQLQSKIISLYHVIEKGLIMPNTRLGYGKDRIELLIKLLKLYHSKFDSISNVHYNSALKVLEAYLDLHKKTDLDLDYIKLFLNKNGFENKIQGGYYNLNKKSFIKQAKSNFLDLTNARNSIRNFSNEAVSIDDIKHAIKIAQSSPSTCNRQASRVYLLTNKEKIEKVLEIQSGSRGFGNKIDKLLMICFDIKSYQGSGDRYTGYIDSSLFAMTLIYALTYKGLGSISLNWSKRKELDLKLREIINIQNSHNVVFFIGVGHLNERTKIAVSKRYNLEDVIINN
jgi:nitroreductase